MKKLKYLFFTTLTIFIFSACSNLNNILDIENKKSEDIQEKSEIVNTSENLPKITEKKEYFSDYKGEGPVLYAKSIVPCKQPKEPVIDFSK